MTLTFQIIGLLAGIAIFWRVEPVLNLMSPHCRLPVRLAFWLLTVGACGLILTITQGYVPSLPVLCVIVGTALLLASERRIRGLLRLHTPTKQRKAHSMTPEQLQAATGCARFINASLWLAEIEAAMTAYGIDTPQRQAAFLAQIGHESGGLLYTTEIWGPTPAQSRYEGRADLGNTQPGDGKRFRGHGLIQVTGRDNHARARDRLRAKFPDVDVPDFEQFPEKLAEMRWAALSAADFWDAHGINEWADRGDFDGVSDVINRGRKTAREGDANGYADRLARYEKAREVLA